jgi:alpha-glucosidase (family GH31 glycosyl hydrolase)
VPNDIVGGITVDTATSSLGDYVTITADPFTLSIKTPGAAGVPVLDITGQLLDTYMNVIQTQLHTGTGADFRGIFGLGERVGGNLFYPDGVYSMWARDVASPVENGKAPGNNLYGTHPFYVYQVNPATWAGVFTKLAAAQDWWIKNDATAGKININTIAAGGMADIFVIINDSPKKVIQGYWGIVGSPVLTP